MRNIYICLFISSIYWTGFYKFWACLSAMEWILLGFVQNFNYWTPLSWLEIILQKTVSCEGILKGVDTHTVDMTTPGRDNMELSQWERCPLWREKSFTAVTKHWEQQLLALQPGSDLASHWFIESAWSCASLEGIFLHIPFKNCSQIEICRPCGMVHMWTCAWPQCHPPGTAFPGIPWAVCQLAGHELQCTIAAGISLESCLG